MSKTVGEVLLRPSTAEDYPALVDIWNRAYPEYPKTEKEVRFQDEHRQEKCKHFRVLASRNGEAVGHGEYMQWPGMYHPRKFEIDLTVLPECQGQGIGRLLYDEVLRALEEFEPISLTSGAREDYTRAMRFLSDRGYTEVMRAWESRLDPASIDYEAYADRLRSVEARGSVSSATVRWKEIPTGSGSCTTCRPRFAGTSPIPRSRPLSSLRTTRNACARTRAFFRTDT